MRAHLAKVFFTILLAVVLAGCSRMTNSGIPKALNTDTLLQTAGNSQGITLVCPSSEECLGRRSVETERRFSATISSGTSGQLLAAYRRGVEHTIDSMGGKIGGKGFSGTEDDVRDFSYSYTWGGNGGIVRAYSFAGTNGEVQIVLFCYEHGR